MYGNRHYWGGFTMSLFIGSLAFEETSVNLLFDERDRILLSSLFSDFFFFGLFDSAF